MRTFYAKMLATMALSTLASVGHAGPLDEVFIRGISYGGPGCQQGTVGQLLASDKQSFTLLFDSYIAEIGPGVARKEARKFCQVSIDLHIPQGYSYTVGTFDTRGWAKLDRGVSGTQTSKYYFDNTREGKFSTRIDGAYDNDFLLTDRIGIDTMVWSRCGENRLLNIKTEVELKSSNRNAAGVMGVDSIDGKVAQVYGFQWKRCP